MTENNIDTVMTEEMEKTFTQDEVNKIVSERLTRDRAKAASDLAKREQELAQRELHMTAKELLTDKGLPVQLISALNCTDEETMEKSIETIEKIFNDYKANAPSDSDNKFVSFIPSMGVKNPDDNYDTAIRKAMGLRT